MVKLFILIKRKGAKKITGAIPTRSSVSPAKLKAAFSKQIRPGFSFKIVSETALKKLLLRMAKGTKVTRRKKTRRSKRSKRRKRRR